MDAAQLVKLSIPYWNMDPVQQPNALIAALSQIFADSGIERSAQLDLWLRLRDAVSKSIAVHHFPREVASAAAAEHVLSWAEAMGLNPSKYRVPLAILTALVVDDVAGHNRRGLVEFPGSNQGADGLTMRQEGGPGFFHASISDGQVTIGCSTRMSPSQCFEGVKRVASEDRGLRAAITTGPAFRVVQSHRAGLEGMESRPTVFAGGATPIAVLMDLATGGLPAGLAVMRVDLGKSSWQWDDISSGIWPTRRCFGGLAELPIVQALTDVAAYVGDEWVQEHFKTLIPRAVSFVREHAG